MTALAVRLRDRRIGVAAAGSAIGLGLLALSSDDGPVLCPFRRCTGINCPGCGLTRSVGRLAQGDLAGSLSRHPLGPVIAFQLAIVALVLWRRPDWLHRAAVPLLIVNGVVLVLTWIVRTAAPTVL